MNNLNQNSVSKKSWNEPEIIVMKQVIQSGLNTNVHEASFTPTNHNQLSTDAGVTAAPGPFSHYVS